MDKTLNRVLSDQRGELLCKYCIHTVIVTLLQAIKKECTSTCNYAKGHGDHLDYYMHIYHPKAYLFHLLGLVVAVDRILVWKVAPASS